MKTIPLLSLLVTVISLANVQAQDVATNNPPPERSAADQNWDEIQARLAPPLPGDPPAPQDAAARAQLRLRMAARFNAAADDARAFREKFPDHPKAAIARQLEAKSLLNAAMAGDNSRESQAEALVVDVRRDSRLPAKLRLETVALADIVRLRGLIRDREKFLAAHEASARALIAEFNGEPGGYEALFRLAESHPDDAKGAALAKDVLAMPAPATVKAQAQEFLDRQALVGQSLPKIAAAALGSANAIGAVEGKPVILYAWATWSPGSIAQARNLPKIAPAGVVFVGVNLDNDVTAARALAQAESLPGSQVYDERGRESPLAQALKLVDARRVYVANAKGEIRQVAAQQGDLTAKLTDAFN